MSDADAVEVVRRALQAGYFDRFWEDESYTDEDFHRLAAELIGDPSAAAHALRVIFGVRV